MGRYLMRVPLGFDAPINEPWSGYLNPYQELASECAHCKGTGFGPRALEIESQFYGNSPIEKRWAGNPYPTCTTNKHLKDLAYANAVYYTTSGKYLGSVRCEQDKSFETQYEREQQRLNSIKASCLSMRLGVEEVLAYLETDSGLKKFFELKRFDSMQADMVPRGDVEFTALEFAHFLAAAPLTGGSGYLYFLQKYICEKEKVPLECAHCKGEGSFITKANQHLVEQWTRIEPPKGEGYQMWQSVSDGPISPVFQSARELARYCAQNPWGADKHNPPSEQDWIDLIEKF